MVGADVRQLVRGAFGDPGGKREMALGAARLAQRPVRDLADQPVPEVERALARDRRVELRRDELALEQPVERRAHFDIRRERVQRAAPEHAPDQRGVLQHELVVGVERVDLGGDQRLHRVRDPLERAAVRAGEDPRRLLEEQRVALGPLERECALRRRDVRMRQQRVDQLAALLGVQRAELERLGPRVAAAPARPRLEQVRPRDADDQHRRVAERTGEVLDHFEERLVRPVHVLEDEHERLRLRELLGPQRHRPHQLAGAALVLGGAENAERDGEQVGDGLALAAEPQLVERLRRRSVVADAGGRLDHRCQRPERDPLAVRKRAAAERRHALGAGDELRHEPRLADARLAEHGDQARAPVADRARQRVREQLELLLAADEPRGADTPQAHRALESRATSRSVRARPLISTGPASSTSTAPAASRRTAGPSTISPGPAACWRRAAMFTGSPVANVDSASSTTTSPASTPIRASRPRSCTSDMTASAARTARTASSSCVRGTPNAAITASPANFSTLPPCCSMQADARTKYSLTRRRTISGSTVPTSVVESTRSTKSTVASFRSTR